MTSLAAKEKKTNIVRLHEPRRLEYEPKLRLDGEIKQTRNNKQSGVSSETYPFKSKEEISAIMDVLELNIKNAQTEERLREAYRNKLLIVVGMNLGLRAGDLRRLRWSFFFDLDQDGNRVWREWYSLQPEKQRKAKKFVKLWFNDAVRTVVEEYIDRYPISVFDLENLVFVSRQGTDAITVQSIWNIVNAVASQAGITQNIGSHTLRKTWGYWCWHTAEDKQRALVILQKCFNHSDTLTTMRYIGLLDNEIAEMYNSISLGVGEGIIQRTDG